MNIIDSLIAKKIVGGGGGGGSVPEYTGSYTVTPSEQTQTLATKDKKATANITVNPIPSQYVVPQGTKSITQNGTGIDVSAYADVDVNVPSVTPTGTISITQNGQVDVTNYATADVAVPTSGGEPTQPTLDSRCGLFLIDVPYSGFGITLRLTDARYSTVNWGDGATDTSSSSAFTISHIYSGKGYYWIKVVAASSSTYFGTATSGTATSQNAIDGFGDTTGVEARRFIRKILIKDISVGKQAFLNMTGAAEIQIDAKCYSGSFMNASITKKLVIGSSVSYGGWDHTFGNCSSLTEMVFLNPTCIAVSNSNCFSNLYSNCKIYVPFASLAAYLTATNYPSPSTYTYIGFATYANGATLPTQDTTAAYNVVWYATKEDAIAQTNAITTGNGSEIYCRYTAV